MGGRKVRTYSSILGCIIRKYFPGAIKLPNGYWEAAWTWMHYRRAKDLLVTRDKFLVNCQTYFQMDLDYPSEECIAVSRRAAAKQVTDTMYEARVSCVHRWYVEKRKLKMEKSQARDIFLEPWQYLQVPPPFVGHARPRVYWAMVYWWTSTEYKSRHEERKLRRAEIGGGSYTQGSIPMAVCKANKEHELGAEPSLFTIWRQFHKKKDKVDGTLYG